MWVLRASVGSTGKCGRGGCGVEQGGPGAAHYRTLSPRRRLGGRGGVGYIQVTFFTFVKIKPENLYDNFSIISLTTEIIKKRFLFRMTRELFAITRDLLLKMIEL